MLPGLCICATSVTFVPITPLVSQHASSSSQTHSSHSIRRGEAAYTIPEGFPAPLSSQHSKLSGSIGGVKSPKEKPSSKFSPPSLLARPSPPERTSPVPLQPTSPCSMTSTGLLERISREDYQKGAPPQEPLNSLEPLSNLGPTHRVQLPETL